MQPTTDKDLEVFVDAGFCGDWDPKEAAPDLQTEIVDRERIHRSKLCPQRCNPGDGTVEGNEEERLSDYEDASPSTLLSIRGQQRSSRNGTSSQVPAPDETPQRQTSSFPGLRREKRDEYPPHPNE
jgi:hypothetical protein